MEKTDEAIILAGGLGTRLSHLLPDLPKCMAPVNNKPFLEYILNYLSNQHIKKVILSVGYRYEPILKYFGNSYKNLSLIYAVELEPLGTGGAVSFACKYTQNQNVFIINGDTLFPADLSKLKTLHYDNKADISIIVRHLDDTSRFGTVIIDKNNRITGFREKQIDIKKGYINGGIYMINKNILHTNNLTNKFSFEKDLLEKLFSHNNFYALISEAYFIDIGVPEDYRKAEKELTDLFSNEY